MKSKINPDKVLELIARVSKQPIQNIKPEMGFRSDLRMDSLQSLDLLVLIEEDLGFEIPQSDAVKLQTVQQLLEYLK